MWRRRFGLCISSEIRATSETLIHQHFLCANLTIEMELENDPWICSRLN
jgi:hypothetical protein